MSTYNFTSKEKAAIVSVIGAMTQIDGSVKGEEIAVSVASLTKLGVDEREMDMGAAMDAIEAVSIIRSMTPTEKKLVSAILTSIMIVDGQVDDSEAKLLMLLGIQTGIPMMSADEAIQVVTKL